MGDINGAVPLRDGLCSQGGAQSCCLPDPLPSQGTSAKPLCLLPLHKANPFTVIREEGIWEGGRNVWRTQRVPDPGGLSHHALAFPGEQLGHPQTCAWLHRALHFSPKQLLLPSGQQRAIRKLTAGFSLRSGKI